MGEGLRRGETPYSEEAEIGVLGAMAISEEAATEAFERLAPVDFQDESHRLIFRAMCHLYEEGESIEPVALSDLLKRHDVLERAGGMQALSRLVDAVPTAGSVGHHIEMLRDYSQRRRMIEAGSEIVERAHEEAEVEQALDEAEQLIFDIAQARGAGDYRPVGEVLWEAMDRIDERAQMEGEVVGTPTGFDGLDELIGGLQDGHFYVVAGRPSMGKSALAVNILAHVTCEQDTPAMLFTMEDGEVDVVTRMLCMEAAVDSQRLQRGDLREGDYQQLSTAAGRIREAPLWIDDSAGQRPLQVRAKTRRLCAREEVGLVVVDYLQLMDASGESRRMEVTNISRSLKGMAQELDVPVIAVSQLSRAPEHRENKRPRLSDLRETGAIEQDADVVIFVYRPEVYLSKEDAMKRGKDGDAEIIVAKQRNGPTDTLEMYFRKEYTRFEETTYRGEEGGPAGPRAA